MAAKKPATKKKAPDRTLHELQKNTKQLQALNSFKRNFALSLVRGVGVTLGATIVAGVMLTLIYNAYTSSLDTVPFLKDILPKSTVEPYFNR